MSFLICFAFVLGGCVTTTALTPKVEFPEIPSELLIPPPELKTIDQPVTKVDKEDGSNPTKR